MRHLLSPTGRLARQDFWIAAGGLVAAGIVARLLPLVGGVAGLLLLWPWTCIAAKRLHDMGRTARWAALPIVPMALVGLLGLAMTTAPLDPGSVLALAGAAMALGSVAMLVGLAFLVWLCAAPGQPAANRWGNAPAPILLTAL